MGDARPAAFVPKWSKFVHIVKQSRCQDTPDERLPFGRDRETKCLLSQWNLPNRVNKRQFWHTRPNYRDTNREHRKKWSHYASRVSSAGETWHTCLRPESHGTQQRCWRWSRSPERVRDAMRCRDEPESRNARSVPNRRSVASRRNGGRRHGLDQASAGPEGELVQKSIGAVSLVRRQKTGPIPQPVSRFVCLTWGNIETIGCVWSLVIGSRVCFRNVQVGRGSDAARGQPARDHIVLLPVSCVPPFRPTGHLRSPRDHCGSGGGATVFRTRSGRGGHAEHRRRCARVSPPRFLCCATLWIAAGEASPGGRVAPSAPSKTHRVFRARCALRPAPPPLPARTRSLGPPGTLEHWRSLRGRAALPPSLPNDRLRATDHVLATGVPERETPAALAPPPAPLALILSFLPPALASSNRHAAGVPRGPAARPCALATTPPLSPSPPPAFKSRPPSPPLFPSMTRKTDRERDTERRRDQRRRHQERLAVLARSTGSFPLAGCPPCSTSAPPRGGPALPMSVICAPPASQGPPVAGGACVPPPNRTPNQGGGNWVGGAGLSSPPMRGSWGPRPSTDPNQGGRHLGGGARRASLAPRDEWEPPAPWQENLAGGRWEQPPNGGGGHGGRGGNTGGRRVSPRRCGWAPPAGRLSQAGGQWDPSFQPDHEYGGRERDSRDRDGSPRRNVWGPPDCQGQGAQEPGGYGSGGFPAYRQPSPRRNWVPPGGQRPDQPGGFGPLSEDWWPPCSTTIRGVTSVGGKLRPSRPLARRPL